jgi:hypothetical protein
MIRGKEHMQIGNTTYGQHIEGTHLTFFGRAPRQSATARHRVGWYWCELCKDIKVIRIKDVRPDHTVSCGCKGHKDFDRHNRQRAANLSIRTRREIFRLHYAGRKRSLRIDQLVYRFHLDKYLIVYALMAHRAALLALRATKSALLKLLSKAETWWLGREEDREEDEERRNKYSDDPDNYEGDRSAYLKSLPWWDHQAYIHEEIRQSIEARAAYTGPSWAELMDSILHDPTVEVEFGHGGPFIPIDLRFA